MNRIALLLALGVAAALIGNQARAQPVGPDKEAAQQRLEEFSRRYRFDQWPGRDAPPLMLTRVSTAVNVEGLPLEVVTEAYEPTFERIDAAVFGHVEVLLWPQRDGQRDPEASPVGLRLRIFDSAEQAQRSLMAQIASPLVSMSPRPGNGTAYGEQWIDGIGDVCLANPIHAGGHGRLECVVSNVWFTLQLARPLDVDKPNQAISRRLVDIARALVQNLQAADQESRQSPAPKLLLKRASIDQTGAVAVADQQPLTSIQTAPGAPALLSIELENPGNPDAPSMQRAQSTAGSIRYHFDPETGVSTPQLLTLEEADKGRHQLFYLVQYPDGSFGYAKAAIDVR